MALLSFAQAASAEDVDHFARAAPPDVVSALQATVEGLVGTLPHHAFKVKVSREVVWCGVVVVVVVAARRRGGRPHSVSLLPRSRPTTPTSGSSSFPAC
jgi:hypothetical protein